jgi:thymidylate synthase ThyX
MATTALRVHHLGHVVDYCGDRLHSCGEWSFRKICLVLWRDYRDLVPPVVKRTLKERVCEGHRCESDCEEDSDCPYDEERWLDAAALLESEEEMPSEDEEVVVVGE